MPDDIEMPENLSSKQLSLESVYILLEKLDEKFTLLLAEAEKRNGQRFDAQQDAAKSAMMGAEKAVIKAETAAERRFESVNEFRKSLSDQTATFLTRNEYQVQHQALTEKTDLVASRMSAVEKSVGEMRERSGGRNDTWLILVAVLTVAAPLAIHFLLKIP